ncbi:MAG: dTDP-4-amino-4,6-dideoxygalactose transaminase [Candidatus Chisholmbacteria bacterium RIFCSPLOWO2_01_FULL_50_28]|uniref:dTDP-4-amino-4,6-dideoxygalactose transaminase n=1 Tax=Candidatus Chisholmbacteria bacterium RIFCSPHIGHO2_01_FULL_52_32 TaxID=1797591 RepID=A0A1G1VSZ1_9BACT|nr:MAG: dTDP-4-amino-4,6-dideoxygalactose transaminase [Candidatus Chisholmbacteria bacterium RIFCSPHIGHO2_01_FULL_52_32]OGY20120.1 MAG: dTDP-4-amino-4,6-dideoxygalactose transaminase [Candidatus Chisholmbacteria bacterium RIFCSPLOWO2_01_FULL_50_28]
MAIVFTKPTITGNEQKYFRQALQAPLTNRHWAGDGPFTRRCSSLIEKRFKASKVLLTPSGTHALELAALLLNLGAGDEVIVPSFTFSSSINCFMLAGARPVFVDVREDTLNIDEHLIEKNISKRTRAIFPVHYAGVSCNMKKINAIAKAHGLAVVEDAAQAVNARYNGRYLGTIGDLGVYSFHESKNYSCGEGGALVINDAGLIELAEILREKGTNRSKFFRGEVDKYTWVDVGSSYLLSDLLAAILYAQLENLNTIQRRRRHLYRQYERKLHPLAQEGKLRLPVIPKDCQTNYHIFYILLPTESVRNSLMDYLKKKGILAVFHYIPLHTSPMGKRLGYKRGDFPLTEELSGRLLRLPLYPDLSQTEQHTVIRAIQEFFTD